jgi:endo-alpha-1,4-polygalactosaminidase (GH114 family)
MLRKRTKDGDKVAVDLREVKETGREQKDLLPLVQAAGQAVLEVEKEECVGGGAL